MTGAWPKVSTKRGFATKQAARQPLNRAKARPITPATYRHPEDRMGEVKKYHCSFSIDSYLDQEVILLRVRLHDKNQCRRINALGFNSIVLGQLYTKSQRIKRCRYHAKRVEMTTTARA